MAQAGDVQVSITHISHDLGLSTLHISTLQTRSNPQSYPFLNLTWISFQSSKYHNMGNLDLIEGGYWVRCFKLGCLYSCRKTYEFSRHFRGYHDEPRGRRGDDGYLDRLLVIPAMEGPINRARWNAGETAMAPTVTVTLFEYRATLQVDRRTTLTSLLTTKRQASNLQSSIPTINPTITTSHGSLMTPASGVSNVMTTYTPNSLMTSGPRQVDTEGGIDIEMKSPTGSDDSDDGNSAEDGCSKSDNGMEIDLDQQTHAINTDIDALSITSDRQAKYDAYKKLRHPAYGVLASHEFESGEIDDEAMEGFFRTFRELGADHPTLRPEQTRPFYMCYKCKEMFARRYHATDHFQSNHNDTLHLYQPTRVPLVLCDVETRRPVRLLEQRQNQSPELMGISVELRRLILRELLMPSQHPLAPRAKLHYQVLEVRELHMEAITVLKEDNFLVKVVVEYDDHEMISSLETRFKDAVPTRIRADMVDVIDPPALSLSLKAMDATESGSQLTTWNFMYNERVFSEVIDHLTDESSILASLEIEFGPHSGDRSHQDTRANIVRQLGHLRDMPAGYIGVRGLESGDDGLPADFEPDELIDSIEQSS